MLMSAGINMHDHFRNLGIDPRRMAEYTMKLQDDVTARHARRRAPRQRRPPPRRRPRPPEPGQGYGPKILDFIHPRGGLVARAPPGTAPRSRRWKRAAAAADRALA